MPNVRHISRVVWRRDWGNNASLALTPVIEVPVDNVVRGDQDEIEAWMSGGEEIARYYDGLMLDQSSSIDAVSERREKTMRLMERNARRFVSEAKFRLDGQLMLHDGYHRAAIRKA